MYGIPIFFFYRINGFIKYRSFNNLITQQFLANIFEVKSLSHVWLFATLWAVAYQAPQSMELSMQEYWSGLPFPSPGDLPNPGIEPGSSTLQADALPSESPGNSKNITE